MTKKMKFGIAIGIQLIILGIIILSKMIIIATGSDVILHIQPADPTDPFRGDYITFQYDISQIDQTLLKEDSMLFSPGQKIFVPLKKNGKVWEAAPGVSRSIPKQTQPYITGMIVQMSDTTGSIWISYGIEQKFIPEGSGRNFSFINHDVTARITLNNKGEPILRQIYVDEVEWP